MKGNLCVVSQIFSGLSKVFIAPDRKYDGPGRTDLHLVWRQQQKEMFSTLPSTLI
jgi:hypothetical protein